MDIQRCDDSHLDELARLRAELWPGESIAEHRADAARPLGGSRAAVAFLAFDRAGTAVGFSEVTRALCEAAAAWGREHGCTEFASDTLLENTVAQTVHVALGFEECERTVCYRKLL